MLNHVTTFTPVQMTPVSVPPAEYTDFALSLGQERLWIFEQLNPGTAAYNVPAAWWLAGPLDVVFLEDAFREVIRRHEALRTRVINKGEGAMQRVLKEAQFRLEVRDLSSEPESTLLEEASRAARTPIPLQDSALFRVVLFKKGPNEHLLFLNLHHAICDEWSLAILRRELAECYNARVSGRRSVLPELPIQFADYAVWQREQAGAAEMQEDIAYWQAQLGGDLPRMELPGGRPCRKSAGHAGSAFFRTLPPGLSAELRELSRQQNVTLFVTLLAGFKALLHRWCEADEVVAGVPFAGRDRVETEHLIGFFVHTQALRSATSTTDIFAHFLAKVRNASVEAQVHQGAPPEAVLQGLGNGRQDGFHPLFSAFFALQPWGGKELALQGIEAHRVDLENGAAKFELSVLATDRPDGVHLRCEYSTERFERWLMDSLMDSYEALLAGVCQNPCQTLGRLPLCSEATRRQLVWEWNPAPVTEQKLTPVPQRFECAARNHPGKVAVMAAGKCLSYEELSLRSGAWAAALRERTGGANCNIGLCLPRNADLVAGLLAILKAGAAYVPLDPTYPAERLQFMVADSQIKYILTSRECRGRAAETSAQPVFVDELESAGRGRNEGTAVTLDALAYLIYTSGSTGQPKGVALEHRGVAALVEWAAQEYAAEDLQGVFAGTSISFDLSVFEILVTLSLGGRVILGEDATALKTHPFRDEITLLNTVPSAARELLREGAIPHSARVINLAGEPLDTALVDQLYRETKVRRVFDLYGPTETTTYSTGTLREPGQMPTIGRPLAGEWVYVLDARGELAPVGMPGELHIGGLGVARGYWGRPELTAERFVDDPFRPGTKIYRTGDLARWRGDATLEFLGRRDHQVKLRGYRVELGEIESVLKSWPGILEAVAVVTAQQQLVAYVVGVEPLEVARLRAYMEAKVPEFMVPNAFIALDRLPRNTNGKVDRGALRERRAEITGSTDPVGPRNAWEQTVAQIWEEVLGRNVPSIDDDFFHLGGHSLMAMRVASRLSAAANMEVPLRVIFDAPTIRQQASLVAQQRAGQGETAPKLARRVQRARDRLKHLDELPNDRVEALLAETEVQKRS